MPAEQIKTSNTPENVNEAPSKNREILFKKHDRALEKASEIMDGIRALEDELDLNSKKDSPRGDQSMEAQINKKHKQITKNLAKSKVELGKKWAEIDQIQAELLKLEVKKE